MIFINAPAFGLTASAYCCPGKIIFINEKADVVMVFRDLQRQGLANTQADTSTLGDASFSVSFVLQLNKGMAEMLTEAQLKGERKTEHRQAYEGPAGLRPSY